MLNIYIIQEEMNGIVECPVLLFDEQEADKHFLQIVKENTDKDFDNIEDANAYLREHEFNSWGCRYWATSTEQAILV